MCDIAGFSQVDSTIISFISVSRISNTSGSLRLGQAFNNISSSEAFKVYTCFPSTCECFKLWANVYWSTRMELLMYKASCPAKAVEDGRKKKWWVFNDHYVSKWVIWFVTYVMHFYRIELNRWQWRQINIKWKLDRNPFQLREERVSYKSLFIDEIQPTIF